jgi:hypothetical protein
MNNNQILKQLNNFRKVSYSPYRWWRSYEPIAKPLSKKRPLLEKVRNGDFDISPYLLQELFHINELNEMEEEYKHDPGLFMEKSSILRTRIKKLQMDFERDENEKLNKIKSLFSKQFSNFSEDEVFEEMSECSGGVEELYYIMKNKNDKNYG